MKPSRRDFLKLGTGTWAGWLLGSTTLASAAVPPTGPARIKPPIVVDTHTHFYDTNRPEGVPWPPREEKRLYRTVLPPDYRTLPVPSPVQATIVVEASPWVRDNDWVLQLAAREPFMVGLVGSLPMGHPEFGHELRRLARNPLFRGLRLRDRKLDGTLEDPAFRSDVRMLADHDLSLDLVGGLEILPYAARLAREFPSLRVIIDHLAGLRIDGQAPPADWAKAMSTLRPCRRVFFKLSGLVEGTGRNDGTAPSHVEFYRPVLDFMRNGIGPERLLYASNWPVSELYAPLATVQGIVADYFQSHHRSECEHVFWRNSQAAYRWKPRRPLASSSPSLMP